MTDPQRTPLRPFSGHPPRQDDREPSVAPVAWPAALRALREARGLTQEGWSAYLGVSDVTVRRWERGTAVPTATAEAALLAWCRDQRMFHSYESGPLRGMTLTPEMLSELLATARLAPRPHRSEPATARTISLVPPMQGPESRQIPPREDGDPRTPAQLPVSTTSLIGRETELAFLRSLVLGGSSRLVTLTGAGGAGKTRLALESARIVAGNFPDGVWFVDLAPLTSPALVPQTVATAFDVHDAPGRSLTRGIAAAIGGRRLLLILDNCEHVVTASAALVATVLQECINVIVVATSRQPLHVAGEQVYPLPPLTAPPEARASVAVAEPAALMESEAVRLFVDRARLVRPDFALTATNAGAVAELCRRLDGLPLAIELAAARVRVLSPEQIVARLGDRFRLVARGGGSESTRHQTLGALLDWSYNLLTEVEQDMLRRLSVFRGGCTLEAVEHVCGDDGIELADALDLLTSLIEKSLVVADFSHGEARYRLLESVREYAAAKLEAGGEANSTRLRHADWYLAFARDLEAGTNDSPHQQQLDAPRQVVQEFENLRVAFEWSLGDGQQPSTALDLCNALWWFWPYHTLLTEGRTWYERSLAAVSEADPEARAYALVQAGMLAFLAEDYQVGAILAVRAVDEARRLGLRVLAARGLRALALNEVSLWDFAGAQAHLEEAVALTRAVGNPRWISFVLDTLGFVLLSQGNSVEARRCLGEALSLAQAERMEIVAAASYMYLGMCSSLDGDVRGALDNYFEAFEMATRVGHRNGPALIIAALALSVFANGRPLQAAQLLGVWQAQSELLGINAPPRNRGHLEEGLKAIRAQIGHETCETALAAGRSMSLPEVEALVRAAALAEAGTPAP